MRCALRAPVHACMETVITEGPHMQQSGRQRYQEHHVVQTNAYWVRRSLIEADCCALRCALHFLACR